MAGLRLCPIASVAFTLCAAAVVVAAFLPCTFALVALALAFAPPTLLMRLNRLLLPLRLLYANRRSSADSFAVPRACVFRRSLRVPFALLLLLLLLSSDVASLVALALALCFVVAWRIMSDNWACACGFTVMALALFAYLSVLCESWYESPDGSMA